MTFLPNCCPRQANKSDTSLGSRIWVVTQNRVQNRLGYQNMDSQWIRWPKYGVFW